MGIMNEMVVTWVELGGFLLGALFLGLLLMYLWQKGTVSTTKASLEQQFAQERDFLNRDLHRVEEEAQHWRTEATTASQRANGLNLQLTELRTMLEQERRAAQEKLQLVETAEVRWKETFQALSAEALKANSQQFLHLAGENLTKHREQAQHDLDQRKEAVAQLVQPLRERLGEMQLSVQQLEQKREGAYQGLSEQIKQLLQTGQHLQQETSQLVQALRQPQVRGRWGEMQLRKTVELAGMLERCDFSEQTSVLDDEARSLRPDMVVHLPNGREVVVDAKAPLTAYLDALEARPEEQAEHLQRLARHVRDHIKLLSRKDYWKQFESAPEFVVLFIPGEVFFSAALQADASLLDYGAEQRIVLATPTTMIALLKTVAFGWRQVAIEQDARKVVSLGLELHERLSKVFGEHLEKLRKGLESAVKAYNGTVSSLESRVLVSARKLQQLESLAAEPVPEITAAEELPRDPTAPEFTDSSGPSPMP